MSYYNAGQLTLRHPSSHGLQMDFSYTYSNSIDMGSDTERSNELGLTTSNTTFFQHDSQYLEAHISIAPTPTSTHAT